MYRGRGGAGTCVDVGAGSGVEVDGTGVSVGRLVGVEAGVAVEQAVSKTIKRKENQDLRQSMGCILYQNPPACLREGLL